jgi:hypothetical protein
MEADYGQRNPGRGLTKQQRQERKERYIAVAKTARTIIATVMAVPIVLSSSLSSIEKIPGQYVKVEALLEKLLLPKSEEPKALAYQPEAESTTESTAQDPTDPD